jgi:uncharacterized Zn finger protein (UPF0148 family)
MRRCSSISPKSRRKFTTLAGIALAGSGAVVSDVCPICGTTVALLRSAPRRSTEDALRRRIATLRQRIRDLEDGEITPRQLKEDVLWMCPDCQRLMTDLPALDRMEIERRMDEQARQLEQRLTKLERRAG